MPNLPRVTISPGFPQVVGVLGVLQQEEFVVGLLSQACGPDEEAMTFTVPAHGRQASGLVLGPVDDRARVHGGDCVCSCVGKEQGEVC